MLQILLLRLFACHESVFDVTWGVYWYYGLVLPLKRCHLGRFTDFMLLSLADNANEGIKSVMTVCAKSQSKSLDTCYSSALQSRKWQLTGMSQWCRSALCGHPLPALTDNWTHGAASRHIISHTRRSPRSRSYYSFPVPLRVGG